MSGTNNINGRSQIKIQKKNGWYNCSGSLSSEKGFPHARYDTTERSWTWMRPLYHYCSSQWWGHYLSMEIVFGVLCTAVTKTKLKECKDGPQKWLPLSDICLSNKALEIEASNKSMQYRRERWDLVMCSIEENDEIWSWFGRFWLRKSGLIPPSSSSKLQLTTSQEVTQTAEKICKPCIEAERFLTAGHQQLEQSSRRSCECWNCHRFQECPWQTLETTFVQYSDWLNYKN